MSEAFLNRVIPLTLIPLTTVPSKRGAKATSPPNDSRLPGVLGSRAASAVLHGGRAAIQVHIQNEPPTQNATGTNQREDSVEQFWPEHRITLSFRATAGIQFPSHFPYQLPTFGVSF